MLEFNYPLREYRITNPDEWPKFKGEDIDAFYLQRC